MSTSRTLLLLHKCSSMQHLKQIHAQIYTAGLSENNYALSRIMAFCAHPSNGNIIYAHLLFNRIQNPSLCVCNTMLKALLFQRDHFQLMQLYFNMLSDSISPDNYTYPYVFKSCAAMQDLRAGSQVHAQVLKSGFVSDAFVGSTLILMYMACLESKLAKKVFDEIPQRIPSSRTVMITGYSKLGEIEEARTVFDEALARDRAMWGAMISAYVQNNCFKEGLLMFREMQVAGIAPDEGVIVSVLCACGQLGDLDRGVWIHNYVIWIGIPISVRLGTALVDMYVKSGSLVMARKVFCDMLEKDTMCWNVMILGLAMHGDGEGALELFADMQKRGQRPDDATFLAMLSACKHSGMVEQGLNMFCTMRNEYNVEPSAEHYGCMVDFLGRSGRLEEAKELLERMPKWSRPSERAVAWRALLSACWSHGQVQMAQVVAEHLWELEAHSGVFVLLSNVYEGGGRRDDAGRVRKSMRQRMVPKLPGCSSIEIAGRVHEFVAGEHLHPGKDQIYGVLETMIDHLGSVG